MSPVGACGGGLCVVSRIVVVVVVFPFFVATTANFLVIFDVCAINLTFRKKIQKTMHSL